MRPAPRIFCRRPDFSKASLYANLKDQYGITPATAEQTLEAALADSAISLVLHLEVGAPVLRQTRLTRDTDGRPFEFVRSTYRGDAFVMRVHLTVGMEGPR